MQTLPNSSRSERVLADAAARLSVCLARLRRGPGDSTMRCLDRTWWRAARTPEGPSLAEFGPDGAAVRVRAWGPGAAWVLQQATRLLGADDDPEGFQPHHPVLGEAWRRYPQIRVGATDLVCESLLPAVIEQKVTGAEAFRSIHRLTRAHADPAPGPSTVAGHPAEGMRLPLSAEQWRRIPSWEFLRAGVEQRRSTALCAAAARAGSLERTLSRPGAADRALCSIPGIGAWTSARTRQQAHGDADAWSVGDYHIPRMLSWALVGEVLDDDAVAEVLMPYAGHRYRVELLIRAVGAGPNRHGPRKSLPTHLPR